MLPVDALNKLYSYAPIYRELFDKQLEFVLSPSRYLSALCSSRAGKTTACAVRAIQDLTTHPNSFGVYLALTDDSVGRIFMPIIKPLLKKYNIKATVNASEIIFDNGSSLLLAGANHVQKIEGFRGIKPLFCIIDEAASFKDSTLKYLIDEIMGPRLADLNAPLILTGTPAAHCRGIFYDVTKGKEPGWDIKKWTAFDNPYMKDNFKADTDAYCLRKRCDYTHPTIRRERFGEWCADDESLLIHTPTLLHPPESYNRDGWRSVIGVDFGFNDQTAFSVIGWKNGNPRAYVLESTGFSGINVSTIAQHLLRLRETYNPIKFVGDPAGASKILIEEFAFRYHINMEAAMKTNKAHYIEIMNDAIVNAELVLHPDNTKELQEELKKLVWNEDRTRELEGVKCDHFDATLYGFRAALNYLEKIPVIEAKTEKQMDHERMLAVEKQIRERQNSESNDPFYRDLDKILGGNYGI